MRISGSTLSTFQRCPRRMLIESSFSRDKFYAPHLLSLVMRPAIIELSNGMDVQTVSVRAVNAFLKYARQPGLDGLSGKDTYSLAMDYLATIRTILERLSRITLLSLRVSPPVPLRSGLEWEVNSPQDESGVLHRWKFVDFINDTTLVRELHSWEVLGDMAVTHSPLMLHLVSVGRRENSHLVSPWCRAYSSPAIMNHYRFQRKGGDALAGSWKSIWFGENADSDPVSWVDVMEDDGVINEMIRHVNVNEPHEDQRKRIVAEIDMEAERIKTHESLGYTTDFSFSSIPMSRPACDSPYTCPHQIVCYSLDSKAVLREQYTKRKS